VNPSPSCRGLVIDLLALFDCEHLSQRSLPDKEVFEQIFIKMSASKVYVSRAQLKRYEEVLARLSSESRWGGHLARLIARCEELRPDGSSKEWAEDLWPSGFHKREYVELYAGILSKFKDCSADCALLCTSEESEEQFRELYNELRGSLHDELEYDYIRSNKVLLRKL